MWARVSNAFQDASDLLVEALSASNQRQRIEIALQGDGRGQGGDRRRRFSRRVEPDGGEAGRVGEFHRVASPPREGRR